MKRRSALKQLGTGLSAGLVLPWLASCKDEDIRPEIEYSGTVAVIGAGASGLYAADYLLSKGINTIVFEASDRIGGRIRTLRPFDKAGPGLWFNSHAKLSSDFPIELGADRVLGSDSIWANFIRKEKFSTQPLDDESDNLYWLNGNLEPFENALQDPAFASAYQFIQDLALSSFNGSVQDAINAAGIPAEMASILYGRIGNKYGTSNPRLGIRGVSNDLSVRQRNNDNLLLARTSMADVLIEGYIRASEKVQLNTIIKSINYEGDKVQLSGDQIKGGGSQPFSFEADKVIVTVPISVLKDGDIAFTPSLPASKITALNNMGMDSAVKIAVDFKKNFWGDSFSTIYGGTFPEYFNAGKGRSDVSRVLQVSLSGAEAEAVSDMGTDVIPVILAELDQMFGSQASSNVRRDAVEDKFIAVIQNWGKEPFIKGSRSYLKPGGTTEHRAALATSLGRKVFFAGEATDTSGDAGTVNGALISAERVAQELIESLV